MPAGLQEKKLRLNFLSSAPLEIGVQGIGVDTALVHIQRLLSGDHDPDGIPRKHRRGVLSWLLMHDAGGHWKIRSAHNTNTVTAT